MLITWSCWIFIFNTTSIMCTSKPINTRCNSNSIYSTNMSIYISTKRAIKRIRNTIIICIKNNLSVNKSHTVDTSYIFSYNYSIDCICIKWITRVKISHSFVVAVTIQILTIIKSKSSIYFTIKSTTTIRKTFFSRNCLVISLINSNIMSQSTDIHQF